MKRLTRHLDDVGESYAQHLCHAMGFALTMIGGGLACLAHALFPFLFVTTGSRCISALHDRMVVNRRSLTPKRKSAELLRTT